jgi:hypothetical protein
MKKGLEGFDSRNRGFVSMQGVVNLTQKLNSHFIKGDFSAYTLAA